MTASETLQILGSPQPAILHSTSVDSTEMTEAEDECSPAPRWRRSQTRTDGRTHMAHERMIAVSGSVDVGRSKHTPEDTALPVIPLVNQRKDGENAMVGVFRAFPWPEMGEPKTYDYRPTGKRRKRDPSNLDDMPS